MLTKAISYITDSDANNLYGHSMFQLLLTEILDWVNPKDFNLGNCFNHNPIGCLS